MKKKKTISQLYLLFLGLTLLLYGCYSIISNNQVEDYSSIVKDIHPNISKLEQIHKSPLTFKAHIKNDTKKEYFVTCTEAVGYQSIIEVMTMIDKEGIIENVIVFKHGETPAFFDKLVDNKFTDQFNGLEILEPIYNENASGYPGSSDGIETNNKVDAVTGSTISSVAISKAVNDGTTLVAKKYFDVDIINPYYNFKFGLNELGLLLIYIIALLSSYKKIINKYRKWILLYTAIIIGFYLNKFITFGTLYSFFNGSWPTLNNIAWYLLIFGTIGLILISGKNLYCLWVCPFGAAQEVILKFGGLKQIKLHPKLVKLFRLMPPTLAYLALMIVIHTKETHALAYDPFGAIYNLTALSIMWKTLPLLIFISLIQYRFYCNYFCPIGFILNLITKLRNKGVKLWKKKKVKA